MRCPHCDEDLDGDSSHYHCPHCLQECSVMGHYDLDGDWYTCDPAPVVDPCVCWSITTQDIRADIRALALQAFKEA